MLCDKCVIILEDVISIKMNEKLGKVSYSGVFNVELVRPGGNVHKLVMLDNDFNYCCLCGIRIETKEPIIIAGMADIHPIKDNAIFNLLDTDEYDEDGELIPKRVVEDEEYPNEPYDPFRPTQDDIDIFNEINEEDVVEVEIIHKEEE